MVTACSQRTFKTQGRHQYGSCHLTMATSKYDCQRAIAGMIFANQTASSIDNYFYGSINCCASLIFWLNNAAYLTVNLKIRTADQSLQLLATVNVLFDMTQLISHFYSGIVLISKEGRGPEYVDKAFGAFLSSSWIQTTVNIMHLMALRLFIVLSPTSFKRMYKKPNLIIIPSIGVFLLVFVSELSPLAAFLFEPASYTWFFDTDLPLSALLDFSDVVLIVMYLTVSLISYLIIARKLLTRAGGRRETILTIQNSIYCLYTSCVFVFWVLIDPIVVSTPPALFVSNFLWLVWNGLTPMLEIIFNKRVRKGYSQLFSRNNNSVMVRAIGGITKPFSILVAT
ncbi:hypothetical protein Q1695_009615 [Nippostrongylus brasiliensis]|nr:hypothetical protein Q1695_009615 [Nippostrongylus brasiliensis]